jgi:hypothetical protein
MSGDATTAYAFLLQAINTCLLLDGNEAGRTDIRYVADKLRAAFSDLRAQVCDLPSGRSAPDVPRLDVVLFGWSWRRLRFEAYSFRYDRQGELTMQRISSLDVEAPYGVYFAGDAGPRARRRLIELLQDRGIPQIRRGQPDSQILAREANLNWEPLEVLIDLIRDPDVRTVGGVPQLLRIYQYGLAEAFVWRDETGDYFGGRRVGPTERYDRRIACFDDGQLHLKHSDRSVMATGAVALPADNDGSDPHEPGHFDATIRGTGDQ